MLGLDTDEYVFGKKSPFCYSFDHSNVFVDWLFMFILTFRVNFTFLYRLIYARFTKDRHFLVVLRRRSNREVYIQLPLSVLALENKNSSTKDLQRFFVLNLSEPVLAVKHILVFVFFLSILIKIRQ